MTPYQRRAVHRERRRRANKLRILFAPALRHRDADLSDEEYIERVKAKVAQMSWWCPWPAPGVSPHRRRKLASR